MKKFITYEKKDLDKTLGYIENKLDHIHFWATMFKEQSEGKRENMTMADSKEILADITSIRHLLEEFRPL